jgi:hypothetical protein
MAAMTDAEYIQYLQALARKHLQFAPVTREPWYAELPYDMAYLESVARLLELAKERPNDPGVFGSLQNDLRGVNLANIVAAMENTGVLDALDEDPQTTFGELRKSAIPPEDAEFLRRAGVKDADAEMTLLTHSAHRTAGAFGFDAARGQLRPPSQVAEEAKEALSQASQQMTSFVPGTAYMPVGKKKRKLFNGIGKILGGSITAAGNILLVTGTVLAPNPATAYGAIASSAVAVTAMFQGIGDLRGE